MYKKVTYTNSLGETLEVTNGGLDPYRLIDGMNISGLQTTEFTTQAYSQDGDTWVSSLLNPLDFSLYFYINLNGKSEEYYLQQRRYVSSIFNPKKSPATLRFDLMDGNTYYLDVVVSVSPFFLTGFENKNNKWQTVQVQITAHNPLFYSDNVIMNDFTAVNPEFQFPFELTDTPFEFGSVIPNQFITNDSEFDAPVVITISGACTNPIIKNVTTGEFIRLKLTMTDTDVVRIDTTFGKKSVTLNGNNAFNKLDFTSTFFDLVVGENEIDFKADDTGDATLTFEYKRQFSCI